ncbi:hypothetical protein [Rhizobium sp. L1K21]|nr:hypothetical protein [Rhizobium sp. L1K21]MCO6187728.1 hypothetical protein [Rhizobium sp. L1K21]
MSKTNAEEIAENIKSVAKNSSAGGQVGGSHFGQEKDATNDSSKKNN